MTVAFIGHRRVPQAEAVEERVRATLRPLIENERADTFLLGSRGEFNELSYRAVTRLRADYPHIRRIYVRAEYPYIGEEYYAYLRTLYEDSFFPPQIENAGRKVYIERNRILVDMCDILICYYNENTGAARASGTQDAVRYAQRRNKRVWNIYEGKDYSGS